MKLVNLLAIAAVIFAGLAANATTYQGIYKNTSFDGTPAKLDVTFRPNGTVSVALLAPSAACSLTFGKSAPVRNLGDSRIYDLPVIESCRSPTSYHYALMIETAADGKRSLSLRGTNGKMTWVYFRAL